MRDKWEIDQFETIAILRAYAQRILDQPPIDVRPSTGRFILEIVSQMHNVKDRLKVR